jgi:CelD/BcsL family acetyltransferase involved in cellulose biosynthesis
MVSVHLSKGREAIESIAREWEALVGDSSGAAAFSRPGWFLAALDAFPARRVVVITARAGDRLIGVLPLARTRTDARGLFLTLVTPPARGDYNAPIVSPEFAPEALPAMLESAFRHFGRHGVYAFPNIPATDPSVDILRSFFSSHRMPWVEERETAPRLRLDSFDFPTVEQTWPASHRKDVRRQRKRLAEQGPVLLWEPETIAEAEPVLEEFFRVHDDKWLKQGFPGMFQDPQQRHLFQAILRRLWKNGAHFSTLRCGSTHISYNFGFFSGGWIQWYRPTYRPEFGGFSPSKIHIAMLIEQACRLEWKGFDFLLGAEGYKTLWCNEEAEVVNIHAGFHRWAPAYFWFSRGKPFVRQRLQLRYLKTIAWFQKRRQKVKAE